MWQTIDPLVSQQLVLQNEAVKDRTGTLELTVGPTTLLWGDSGVNLSQLLPTRDHGSLPILGPHYQFKQHQLGGPVLQYEEGSAAVGDDNEGVGDSGRNCVGTSNDAQSCGTDGVALRDWEFCSDGCDAEGSRGVPP